MAKEERRKGERRQKERRQHNRGIVDRRKADRRFNPRSEEEEEKDFQDQVEGRNSVIELLESGKERKIVIVEKDRRQIEEMAQSENHQGVIAIVPPFEYCEVEDILKCAEEREEPPFVLILDGIEDTHNLGAIIRTAETAGVNGIIIPKRRAASVNATVNKVSSGAVEYMKIARVNNITETINKLKEKGLWICGTAVDAEKYYFNQDLGGPIGIVIGREGKGMSELVKKNCDFLVKIPMMGNIKSLNASVSTGIILYEAVKQRKF